MTYENLCNFTKFSRACIRCTLLQNLPSSPLRGKGVIASAAEQVRESSASRLGGNAVSDRTMRVTLDVTVTREDANAPTLQDCRYAVLPLAIRDQQGVRPCVIYDRWTNRIVDGVYAALEDALGVSAAFNRTANEPLSHLITSPNGLALGLVYPTKKPSPDEDG